MNTRVTWRLLAEQDLAEAHAHVGIESPESAERLLDAVERAIDLLRSRPQAGRARGFRSPRLQGIRSWVVGGFESYLSFYRPVPNGIEVVRFIHGARDIPNLLDNES